jgi:hypothetical protein
VTLRLHEHDRITETTLSVRDDSVQIHAGQRAARIIELSLIDAARLIFGGPAPAGLDRVPTSIRALFPIPIYVPYVDRV